MANDSKKVSVVLVRELEARRFHDTERNEMIELPAGTQFVLSNGQKCFLPGKLDKKRKLIIILSEGKWVIGYENNVDVTFI